MFTTYLSSTSPFHRDSLAGLPNRVGQPTLLGRLVGGLSGGTYIDQPNVILFDSYSINCIDILMIAILVLLYYTCIFLNIVMFFLVNKRDESER